MEKPFFQNLESSCGISLNESQKDAVLHSEGPALVLAVPGAGKTTVLLSRISSLVSLHGVDPSSILSITFSKSSALDMAERFRLIFGKNMGVSPKFSTIHSFAYFVIKEHCRQSGLSYKLIDDRGPQGKVNVLRSIYSELNKAFLSDDKLEELINGIGYVKNMMISPQEFKSSGLGRFCDIYSAYENYKEDHRLIDFDDMLSLCFKFLSENSRLLESYRRRFKYIQVDEGQDTSNIQHHIISLLASPSNNLFIVADDDQSIYGFRGANPEYLLNFKEKYPDASIFKMDTNYRSTVDIVSAADNVIRRNKLRYGKNLVPHSSESLPIDVKHLECQEDQYRYILDSLSPKELDDTAILFRNNLSAIPIADLFDRKGIPFRLKDSKLTFFNHWLLKDLVSFLKLAVDQSDTSSFERIYYKMKGYISKKGLGYVLKNMEDETSVFSVLSLYPELKPFQRESMRKLSLDFARLGKKRPYEAIRFIKSDLEYLKYLSEKSEFLGYGLESNMKLLSHIESLASHCVSILDFLDRLSSLRNLLSESGDPGGVLLSTMHSAKGLEFKRVFIVDMINGDFPCSSSLELMKQGVPGPLEEERRLFYVGMTRAKKHLCLLSYRRSDDKLLAPSVFLSEVESDDISSSDDMLMPGSEVCHTKFGGGVILDATDSTLMIDFKDFGIKQLLKSACLSNGLLKAEKK